jgi:predicted DNA-binding protein (MmcQ/YjbR family)
MKIIESDLSNQIVAFVQNKLGNIFFFNHIAVIELNEGIHFNIKNAPVILNELKAYFGEIRPFGVVANRINSYSVDLLDTPKYKATLKNLISYGVVGHDAASKINATIESSFCEAEKVDHDTIYDAINNVYNTVKKSKLFSLN